MQLREMRLDLVIIIEVQIIVPSEDLLYRRRTAQATTSKLLNTVYQAHSFDQGV